MKNLLYLVATISTVAFGDGGVLRNEAGEHALLVTAPDSTIRWAKSNYSGYLMITDMTQYTPTFDAESILISEEVYNFGGSPVRELYLLNTSLDTLYIGLGSSVSNPTIPIYPSATFSLQNTSIDTLYMSSTDTLVVSIVYQR